MEWHIKEKKVQFRYELFNKRILSMESNMRLCFPFSSLNAHRTSLFAHRNILTLNVIFYVYKPCGKAPGSKIAIAGYTVAILKISQGSSETVFLV